MQPHDLLARVVEHLPVGVFAFSADGRALLWNPRAERLTGWERARVARDGLAGLPLDAPTVRRIRDELLAGRPFRGRIPADVESGATLYFRAAPLPAPRGRSWSGCCRRSTTPGRATRRSRCSTRCGRPLRWVWRSSTRSCGTAA